MDSKRSIKKTSIRIKSKNLSTKGIRKKKKGKNIIGVSHAENDKSAKLK